VVASAETAASGSDNSQNIEACAKHMDEMKSNQTVEFEAVKEAQILPEEGPGKHSEQTVYTASERTITTDNYSVEDSQALPDRPTPSKQSSESGAEKVVTGAIKAPERTDVPCASRDLHILSATKEGKVLHPQVSGQLSPSTSTFNSIESSDESQSSIYPPVDSSLQTAAIQGTLQQVIALYIFIRR
jgi:enhancer of mRNA-decapping protein 4